MPSTKRRRPTGIVLGALVVLMAAALIALFALGGGDESGRTSVRSRGAASSTPTRATSTTTGPPITYHVQRGDTLTAIARRYGVSTDAIVTLNHIVNQDALTEGQALLIPAPVPVRLAITPTNTTVGDRVQIKLTGAKPSEVVTFEIDGPSGSFIGPPHAASADGAVATTYSTGLADPAGSYDVVANGNDGTTARATFRVAPVQP